MHSSDVFKPLCNLEEFPEKSAGSLTVRPNWRLFIVGLRPNRPVTAPPAFTDKRSTDNVRQKIIAHEALFQAVNRVKIFKFDWHALFHIPGMTIALFYIKVCAPVRIHVPRSVAAGQSLSTALI